MCKKSVLEIPSILQLVLEIGLCRAYACDGLAPGEASGDV
jgi:hypothetical protein